MAHILHYSIPTKKKEKDEKGNEVMVDAFERKKREVGLDEVFAEASASKFVSAIELTLEDGKRFRLDKSGIGNFVAVGEDGIRPLGHRPE